MIKLEVPATSANLGPGFDCLGLALNIFNYILAEEAGSGLNIEIKGEGSTELARDESNLTYQAMNRVFRILNYKPKGIRLTQINNIPLSRGLGSSAAAIVGGMVAANKICGDALSLDEVLELATAMEGHPDNVAPALLGGIVIADKSDNKINWIKINPPNQLIAVLAIPEFTLSTELSRNVLPHTVAFKDAVFNVGKTALLVSALCTGQYNKLKYALTDVLHQPYRMNLIPGMNNVFEAAKEAGALGCVISGAGPSILTLTLDNEEKIKESVQKAFRNAGIKCRMIAVSLLNRGVTVCS